MKKSLLMAFALLSVASAANAQGDYTLTREWKTNTTAAGSNARQGCYANGKFYIQNRPEKVVEIWDQTGKLGTLPSTDCSTGICADDAGNIIVTNVTEFAFGKESGTTRPVRIYANGVEPAKDIDLFLACPPPGSLSSDMRCDYFGHVEGNVMSEKGGTVCWIVNRRKYVNVLPIKNGIQDDDNTLAILNDKCFVNPVESFQTQGSAMSTLTSAVAFQFKGQYCQDSRYIGLKGLDVNENAEQNLEATIKDDYTTAQSIWSFDPAYSCHLVGNTLFEMGGEKYIVAMIQYKTGDSERSSSFAIVRVSDGEKVAVWSAVEKGEASIVAKTAGANWITAVPVDNNKTELYQYFPADNAGEAWIAKYTFTSKKGGQGGVDAAIASKAKVLAGEGKIMISGNAADIAVYTAAGALVSKGETIVDCEAGLYIVKVDGQATKVLVR